MAARAQPFRNMLQLEPLIPRRAWIGIRAGFFVLALLLIVALIVWPGWTLSVWWGIVIPLVPLLFFVAPGLWRNICPLATTNQTPRLFGFTRGLTMPKAVADRLYLVPVILLLGLIPARKALFNENGTALAVLLLSVGAAAFAGGLAFKGKSGWCSSICPLLPIQRLYGQTPFATVRNSHCEPCVGCTKNCFDFNLEVAQLADIYDEEPFWSGYRRFFAGAFPGLVLGFFLIAAPHGDHGILRMYGEFAVYVLASLGLFFAADTLLRVSPAFVPTVFAAMAITTYYWYVIPRLSERLGHAHPGWLVWPLRGVMIAVALFWIWRTYEKEERFVEVAAGSGSVRLGAGAAAALRDAGHDAEVLVLPQERRIAVPAGATLLEVIEKGGLPIEAGCRMGMCGADPVCVLEGMGELSEANADELATIERLGLAPSTRMACCARVQGAVSVTLTPERAGVAAGAGPAEGVDSSVRRVVVIGNGIAGITAADYVRRRHPDCEIDVVARESHHLYNRMAISRLIYGRSAMQGLYLQPDSWYDEQRVTTWLNTRASRIDREAKEVVLATGQTLPYDRLIIAAGSASFVPPVEGMSLPGAGVLRDAEDAMKLRAYVQETEARRVIVSGGGLLGLEAAYALHQLGLHVTVLQRGARLLNLQLDERGSEFLRAYLEGLGLAVVCGAEAVELRGDGRVQEVGLKDGQTMPADVFLVAAGVRSNLELAREAGLEVDKGILVDAEMRTSDPAIYAAGDVAEFEGRVWGLWPTAVEQGRVAAVNALGAGEAYVESLPVTMLKVTGADLLSAGRFEPEEEDIVVTLEDPDDHRYRKLVLRDGAIVGAVLFGYPLEAPGVTAAMKAGRDLSDELDALRAGDWSCFVEQGAGVPA
jgi:NADPH-dependent 2,4-dienoyl-CoA reductase/sulfur reductase-like enzyme/ferredoxin